MAAPPVPIATKGTGQEFEALTGPNHQSKNSKSSPNPSVTQTPDRHDPEHRQQTEDRIRNDLDVYFAAVDNNQPGSFTIRPPRADYPILASVAASTAIAFGAFVIEPTIDRALLSATGWLTAWGVVLGVSGWQQTHKRNQTTKLATLRAVAKPKGESQTTMPEPYQPNPQDKKIERPRREAIADPVEDAQRNETTQLAASFAVMNTITTGRNAVPVDAALLFDSLVAAALPVCSEGPSGAERAEAQRSGSEGVSESGTTDRSARPEVALGNTQYSLPTPSDRHDRPAS